MLFIVQNQKKVIGAIKSSLNKLLTCFLFLLIINANTDATTSPQNNSTTSILDKQNCQLKVGWGLWAPYQFPDEQGKPVGLQIELIKKIALEAGCQLTFTLQTFEQNQQSLKNGNIDLTLDTTITKKRQQYGHFSIPYRQEILILYVKPELENRCKNESIRSMINNGVRLGLTRGNVYGQMVSEIQQIPKLNKKLVYSAQNAQHYELFAQGQLDGFFEDPTVMAFNLRNQNKLNSLKSCHITVYSGEISLMFSKKSVSPKIVSRFNQAIKKVKQTPEYINKWIW